MWSSVRYRYLHAGTFHFSVSASNAAHSLRPLNCRLLLKVEAPVTGVRFDPQFRNPVGATNVSLRFGLVAVPAGAHLNLSVDFGDGSPRLQLTTRFDARFLIEFAFPEHTYRRAGVYLVRATAWNHVSAWEGVLQPPARVLDPPRGLNVTPVFRSKPGELVTLSLRLESGTNVTFRWTFGDGNVRETTSKAHCRT